MSGGGSNSVSHRRSRTLYESDGNARAALASFNGFGGGETTTPLRDPAARYNASVLEALLSASQEAPPAVRTGDGATPTGTLMALTSAHNEALAAYASGRCREAAGMLLPSFAIPLGGARGSNPAERNLHASIAFLLIDCILGLGRGDVLGLPSLGGGGGADVSDTVSVDQILAWIEAHMSSLSASSVYDRRLADELKFRHSVYKSRVLLAKQEGRNDMTSDKSTRMARKELKSAMETYNHRLSGGDAASSSAAGGTADERSQDGLSAGRDHSVGSDGAGTGVGSGQTGRPPRFVSGGPKVAAPDDASLPTTYAQRRLDGQSQYALSLKANLEYLKGNPKKALKLTAEARNAGERRRRRSDSAPPASAEASADAVAIAIDDALHLNNLALLHQTNGRHHAALHYYSRALSGLEGLPTTDIGLRFEADGTALPSPLPSILRNASLCAFTVQKYATSYECMARAVATDPQGCGRRGRCWLRMAEACIGVHEELKAARSSDGRDLLDELGARPRLQVSMAGRDLAFVEDGVGSEGSGFEKGGEGAPTFTVVEVDEVTGGSGGNYLPDMSASSVDVGLCTPVDLEQVTSNPLPRAVDCFVRAMSLCQSDVEEGEDKGCLDSAAVSLAYVYLEVGEPLIALHVARPIVQKEKEMISEESKRRIATARMYMCEAMCLLGQADDGLQMLNGAAADAGASLGDNDVLSSLEALDGLARDLVISSGTDEDIKVDGTSAPRVRIETAKSWVHATAAAAAAYAGRPAAGRAHALCALKEGSTAAPEMGATSEGAVGAQARKTLLYCHLKEGKIQDAVSLLESSGRRVHA